MKADDLMAIMQFNADIKPISTAERCKVLTESAIDCLRRTLHAVGTNASHDSAPHGLQLQEKLKGLERRLSTKTSPESLAKTAGLAETALAEWGSAGVNDSKAKADEFRELLLVLAKTAGIIGSNNNVFSQQFTDLTLRLAKIANIGDLTEMRSSLVKSVGEIKESIEQIARESRELIAHLNEKVTTFESIAFKDDLTGLDNRRSIQERIRRLIKEQHIFCVVMIDLNRFKPINDEFGHIVGDELLRKFADRLREVTRLNDLVGRTGGDEFVAVLSCGIAGAEQYVSRLRESVFGRYTIHPRQDKITLDLLVNAAVGVALWQRSEDADQLLGRADAAMYANKRTTRGDLS